MNLSSSQSTLFVPIMPWDANTGAQAVFSHIATVAPLQHSDGFHRQRTRCNCGNLAHSLLMCLNCNAFPICNVEHCKAKASGSTSLKLIREHDETYLAFCEVRQCENTPQMITLPETCSGLLNNSISLTSSKSSWKYGLGTECVPFPVRNTNKWERAPGAQKGGLNWMFPAEDRLNRSCLQQS